MRKFIKNFLLALLSLFFSACIGMAVILVYFELQLPSVNTLKNVQLQVPLRIFSSDGKLIAEFGPERRRPIDLQEIPKQLIEAVIATEDQRYFEHGGIDIRGLMRAAYELISTGAKSQGGSTITMQVARNFFLTPEKTYQRKIKEILLAIKIDNTLSKEKILELYLNKIYFGNRAYGVASAAHVYYGKTLDELTLPELAVLAGLPKAPSTINPLANKAAALDRRNHVLGRMLELNYITQNEYDAAVKAPITAKYHGHPIELNAPYAAEMVRDAMVEKYGKEEAYTNGYNVYITINSSYQKAANKALLRGLFNYSKRHGYYGPEANLGAYQDGFATTWQAELKNFKTVAGLHAAAVTQVFPNNVTALLADGSSISIPFSTMQWAGEALPNGHKGPAPQGPADILKSGDVIRVTKIDGVWNLSQLPRIEGALVSLNPQNGAILALVGGFNYSRSNFNRVTQAQRQPGSNFKPFIYSAALSKGFTLATLINDAPIVLSDPSQLDLWRPENDNRKFYGPTRLKIGLVKSRNLVSIRVLQGTGIDYTIDYLTRFGFTPNTLPKSLSLALGSGVVTPLQIAAGYAVFANGGYKVNPYLIDHISNDDGQLIYQSKPATACEACIASGNEANAQNQNSKPAARAISPQVAYLITDAMKDVIKEGTGKAAQVLNRSDLAGKTGTTNKQIDAWFSGFNSDIVTTVWVGFDEPRSIKEYGAQAALPVWIDFMGKVLKDSPLHTLQQPPGIVVARIDAKTGLLAHPSDPDAIFEIFSADHVPKRFADESTTASSGDNQMTENVDNAQAAPVVSSTPVNEDNDDRQDQPIY